jgi:hypothetical protein
LTADLRSLVRPLGDQISTFWKVESSWICGSDMSFITLGAMSRKLSAFDRWRT